MTLKPCSLKVGMWGAKVERVTLICPRWRSGVPPFWYCRASPMLIAATMICLLATALCTSAAPLNGTWVSLTPAARSKASAARWSSEPMPVVP